MRRKILAGNWKMNKTYSEGLQLVDEIVELFNAQPVDGVEKILAPSFIHLSAVIEKVKLIKNFSVASQNCHHQKNGAYTGEVSAEMVKSTGATYVIIGHSERRSFFSENSVVLSQKVNIALLNNLNPIFCIGESLEERNANTHLEAVRKQLKETVFNLSESDFSKLIIAYEPIWAIGTGVTATSHQAQGMHNFIRSEINKKYGKVISENIPIIYGGSCNAKNAKELFACLDVDGGLIGGASLIAEELFSIANSFPI